VDTEARYLLRLADGREATLTLARASTVVAIDELRVSAFDLCGRPYARIDQAWTYRRGLDGRLLQKGVGAAGRVLRLLAPEDGASVIAAARNDALEVMEALAAAPVPAEASARLRRIATMDKTAPASDAARFASLYRGVGILPPDQYLAVVLEASEGCSWNACAFCELYRGVAFRVKTAADFQTHADDVHAYFGDSLALRRSVFVGAGNALAAGPSRLLQLLAIARARFGGRPLYAFSDVWATDRKGTDAFREYARLGLRRVYVGLETGDAGLLDWLGKPGDPEQAVELVRSLHAAGIAVGVIVLVGAGGDAFAAAHERNTARVVQRMGLDCRDLLYFSEIIASPSGEYTRRAGRDGIHPLDERQCAAQRQAIAAHAAGPRHARYDLRQFVY
jgi:hypothetical protein